MDWGTWRATTNDGIWTMLTDVDLHGIHLAVCEHEYLFTLVKCVCLFFSCLHWALLHSIHLIMWVHAKVHATSSFFGAVKQKGLACDSKPWYPRCPICDQEAHCLTLSLCPCGSQNVSSSGSSLSVKLSHLFSGEPQCLWLYLLHVVGSSCLCKTKMSNPSTTACQDVPLLFLSGGTLCVYGYMSCGHLGPCVLVTMSHLLAAACPDIPSFVRWPIVCECMSCV